MSSYICFLVPLIQERCYHPKFSQISMLRRSYISTGGIPSVSTDLPRTWSTCSVQFKRNKSTEGSSQTSSGQEIPFQEPLDTGNLIPEIPNTEEIAQTLNALGEPTFSSLGLGGWGPIGLVQSGLEMLHVTCDLPWWGAILTGTIFLRSLLIPVSLWSRRHLVRLQNHMPVSAKLMENVQIARQAGDMEKMLKAHEEYEKYNAENKLFPRIMFIQPLIQLPIFLSVFWAVRSMAVLPLESLKTGGILWFTDLTLPDPFMILPLMTATTLFVIFHLGGEGLPVQKYVKWLLPCITFIAVSNFPAAMCLYWMTGNTMSLMLTLLAMNPRVRNFFGIEELIKHPPNPNSTNVLENIKAGYRTALKNEEIEDRMRVEALRKREIEEKQRVEALRKNFWDKERRERVIQEEMKRMEINKRLGLDVEKDRENLCSEHLIDREKTWSSQWFGENSQDLDTQDTLVGTSKEFKQEQMTQDQGSEAQQNELEDTPSNVQEDIRSYRDTIVRPPVTEQSAAHFTREHLRKFPKLRANKDSFQTVESEQSVNSEQDTYEIAQEKEPIASESDTFQEDSEFRIKDKMK